MGKPEILEEVAADCDQFALDALDNGELHAAGERRKLAADLRELADVYRGDE